MTDLRAIIKDIAKLKPIPQVVNRILAIQQDPDSSMEDLAKVISHDAMTTANLLKAVNTAYYARSQPIDSVRQATVYLGMDEVVDLVLMSNSAANLKRPQRGYGLAAGELWRNSVASAITSRELSRTMNLGDTHLAFTGALLKDIGKVVLEEYVWAHAKEIRTLVQENHMSFPEAEKKILGIDHAELGAMTAEIWRFSPEMVELIRHHHRPGQAALARQETVIVHLSDMLCMMIGIGTGSDGLSYRFDHALIEKMGLSERDLQKIMVGISDKLGEIESLVASK